MYVNLWIETYFWYTYSAVCEQSGGCSVWSGLPGWLWTFISCCWYCCYVINENEFMTSFDMDCEILMHIKMLDDLRPYQGLMNELLYCCVVFKVGNSWNTGRCYWIFQLIGDRTCYDKSKIVQLIRVFLYMKWSPCLVTCGYTISSISGLGRYTGGIRLVCTYMVCVVFYNFKIRFR